MEPLGKNRPQVLVVDDEEIVLSFISDALEDENCDVTVSINAEKALELAEKTEYDLVITDIRMPGISGIELVRTLHDKWPRMSVVFMTGYANLNSAKDAIREGASDYIMKPFELNEIRQAVRSALKKRELVDSSEETKSLKELSNLNSMLFSGGDRKSLVISSLKFAMMQQQSTIGSVLFEDVESGKYILTTLDDNSASERELSGEPLFSTLAPLTLEALRKLVLVSSLEEHPIYAESPSEHLRQYLAPDWLTESMAMVLISVIHGKKLHALIMLGCDESSQVLSSHSVQFLQLSSNQLANALENLALLEETQDSYARLQQLQRETIELEKMAARGEISAEIGHELNNFLGIIAGSTSMLEIHFNKGNYEHIPRHVNSIQDAIERIRTISANLMDLKPISSVKEILTLTVVIREVVEYLIPQDRFENVEITVDDIPDHISFEADPTQIRQLLYNLMNNAADATKEKDRGKIRIWADSEEDTFSISIQDNGSGFEPEILEKAFQERFTTKQDGHGFGLMVCKKVVEQNDGTLEIDSKPGSGTKVKISFPYALEDRLASPA